MTATETLIDSFGPVAEWLYLIAGLGLGIGVVIFTLVKGWQLFKWLAFDDPWIGTDHYNHWVENNDSPRDEREGW